MCRWIQDSSSLLRHFIDVVGMDEWNRTPKPDELAVVAKSVLCQENRVNKGGAAVETRDRQSTSVEDGPSSWILN